jgi:low affinity Fe/Cu permease
MVCWLQELLALCGNIGSSCVSLWTACAGEPLNPPIYLVYTFLGAFVFNTGIMVRRIFVWDISGQMFWWSAYRVVLSLGLAAVLNFTTEKLDPHYYFLVAPASVAIFDQLVRNLRAKLLQSDAAPKRNEMSLQLIQGVDYWKEQRLLEEGIESVQHLATADFVALALFTRSPLYTIMDWVDQAIFIQRFPGKADRMADQGLPVSAVELTWSWDPANRQRFESRRPPDSAVPPPNAPAAGSYAEYLQFLADATGAKPGVVARTLDAWSNDNQVQLLTLFWRADLGGDETATGPV